jgi:hypothetical protein
MNINAPTKSSQSLVHFKKKKQQQIVTMEDEFCWITERGGESVIA